MCDFKLCNPFHAKKSFTSILNRDTYKAKLSQDKIKMSDLPYSGE